MPKASRIHVREGNTTPGWLDRWFAIICRPFLFNMDTASHLTTARLKMVQHHLKDRGLRDPRVLSAMERVSRERFVLPQHADRSYADEALPIACRQTISQPYMVALMTEALDLTGSERVLEIGTGSGYQTAVLAELTREVISIERHAALSLAAREVLDALNYGNVEYMIGDGTLGHAARAPYDRIMITAATATVPQSLWDQLAEGGILVAPIGPQDVQTLQVIRKIEGAASPQSLTACRFVPLVGSQ